MQIQQSCKVYGKRGYSNVHSKLYDNMRHEILNEIEKEKVWNDILATLNYWNK